MRRFAAAAILAGILTGCATYPPRHEEFWARGDFTTAQKVTSVAAQVKCELGKAVQQLNANNEKWINSWGALVTFTLDTTEKIGFGPGVALHKPLPTAVTSFPGLSDVTTDQIFSAGFGGQFSSEAERKSSVIFFYTAQELQKMDVQGKSCVPTVPTPGYLFVESELGIPEWVFATASLQTSGLAKFPTLKAEKGYLNQNAISETIKFHVVSSASATPIWKLVRVSANEDTKLIEGSRDRTQQLDITLGPLEAAPGTLSPSAQSQFNAQLIAASISRARWGQ